MPFKKKAKSCIFCEKPILNKIYYMKLGANFNIIMCGKCRDVFLPMRREMESGREHSILRMLTYSKLKNTHCLLCKQFDKKRPEKCKRGMWTGLGAQHSNRYPFSFANAGCENFIREN